MKQKVLLLMKLTLLNTAAKRVYTLNRFPGGAVPVKMQMTGGSQPIAPFINTLGIPALALRIANPDSNIHAPNENIRLGNFHEGIKMVLSVLSTPYKTK